MKKIAPHILYLAIIAVVLFLLFRSCEENSALKKTNDNFTEVLQDSITYYKDKNGNEIATRKALQGEKQSLEMLLVTLEDKNNQLTGLVSHYKKVAAAVQTETITKIDSIEVPYEVPNTEFDIPFTKQEKYYSLSGRSTNKGLYIDNLTIPNTQSIVIGEKKTGLFKTEYHIEVQNSNPLIKTTSVESYTLKHSRKRMGVSLFAGYGMSNTGLSPIVGVGVSYSIFQF